MVVQCTWKTSDGRSLDNAVKWALASEDQSADVEDEVQAENCLLLTAPSAGTSEYLTAPACQLLLSCQPQEKIQEVSVLSEARVLEVYGHHGEYLKTIRNDLLEEVDDMAVFKGNIRLERPLSLCSIKFACLRSKNEMWLYGVKVNVLKGASTPESPMAIPYSEVEQRLQDMGLTLSDKAEVFKQLVEYQKQNFSNLTPQDISSFVQTMKLSNGVPGQSSTFETRSHIDNQSLNTSSEDKNANNDSKLRLSVEVNNNPAVTLQSSSAQTDGPLPPGDLDVIKAHIDEKFTELDKVLWERIQKRIAETEVKLLCKLDEIESFVKPQGVK